MFIAVPYLCQQHFNSTAGFFHCQSLSSWVVTGSAKKSCWPGDAWDFYPRCSCRPFSPVNLIQNKIGAQVRRRTELDKVLKWSQCQAAWPNRWWKILKAWTSMKNFCCSGAMACHPSSRLASAFRPAFLSRGLPHPDSLNSYYCQITLTRKMDCKSLNSLFPLRDWYRIFIFDRSVLWMPVTSKVERITLRSSASCTDVRRSS